MLLGPLRPVVRSGEYLESKKSFMYKLCFQRNSRAKGSADSDQNEEGEEEAEELSGSEGAISTIYAVIACFGRNCSFDAWYHVSCFLSGYLILKLVHTQMRRKKHLLQVVAYTSTD